MVKQHLARGAAALLMLGMAAQMLPSGALAGNDRYNAGLYAICTTDTYVRVGGLNESPKSVTISTVEKDKNGKAAYLLTDKAPASLVAIFPITIPANSRGAVTWDIALASPPGNGNGNNGIHGSWNSEQWVDENGLDYKNTGASSSNNIPACVVPTPVPTKTPEPTKTAEPTKTEEPTKTVEPTVTPSDAPYVAKAANKSTANSTRGAFVMDGNTDTSWMTEMAEGAIPTYAWVSLDLGAVRPVQRIDWLWSESGFADDMRVQISLNGTKWETLDSPNNGPAWDWQALRVDVKARYVRFYFRNPNSDPQLGYLAEVKIFAWADAEQSPDPEPEVSVTPAPTVPAGEAIKIKTSRRSSNSRAISSKSAWDKKPETAWHTEMSTAPKLGWVSFDLGTTKQIGTIEWQFNKVGFADSFKVQISNDGVHWTTIAIRKNADAADTWQTLNCPGTQARYVRFLFNNPNKDENVGWLSEVRFFS